ncbi:MAG: tRNA pseudouridine(55) synthase TruB, partial [Clostridia bacterium]|nr:tRNA pseudouridine(55) synthase TruB [Clostridia bacterium]
MNGIVNLFKPAGMTSFSAAAAVRRLSGERKCGHGGTLDPEATGVLPVLLGKATRLSDVFLGLHKTYRATLRFGTAYDTLDVWGNVTQTLAGSERHRLSELTADEIRAAAEKFTGEIFQAPPAYSALKIGGVPAYKLARKGEVADLQARRVNIYSIEVNDLIDGPE